MRCSLQSPNLGTHFKERNDAVKVAILITAVVFGFFVWSAGRAIDQFHAEVDERYSQIEQAGQP
jgi:hypothetical protein